MCEAARSAGADAIKFQHHIPDEEMLPDIPISSNMKVPLYEFLKRNALSIEQHVEIAQFCIELGIDYLCTPFSYAAAQELEKHVKPWAYKIGSGEMTDHPTLELIAKYQRPMIVSTGMSEFYEIKETHDLLIDKIPTLILMNCTSAYPPKLGDINLGFIRKMISEFPRSIIGHSDHSPEIFTSLGAVSLGARVIEKHITIDESLEGPDQSVSISVDKLSELVKGIREISASLGGEKEVLPSEKEIIQWARRSLVYLKDLPVGSLISTGDLWGKRPGTGVPSKRINDFVGKKLRRSVRANTLLAEEDFF
jgi:N-acetylneuraminate synthase